MLSKLHSVPGTLGFASKYNARRIIMITLLKKASVKWTIVALMILTLLAGCSSVVTPKNPASTTSQDTKAAQKQNDDKSALPTPVDTSSSNASPPSAVSKQDDSQKTVKSIVYKNTQYGFDFTLPVSWNGYTIVTGNWKGVTSGDSQGDKVIASGPIISIRHPLWTSKNPRQDIPIMIFTTDQWKSLQHDKVHIGAAPIGPRELGHNSKYVFALPARYNFAFPTGFEEVETILNSNPLQPTEK